MRTGINIGIPMAGGGLTMTQRLQAFGGGLTFYKSYEGLGTGTVTAAELNAAHAVGSPTATYTAVRAAATPATYVDDAGVVQLVTTADVGRIQGGYYDATGFTAQKGLMVEAVGTNGIIDSYMHRDTAGVATSWLTVTNMVGAVTYTCVDATDIINISGARAQRVQFTGESGKFWFQYSIPMAITSGDTVTGQFLVKGTTGANTLVIGIRTRDGNNVTMVDSHSSEISLSATAYRKFTHTYTTVNVAKSITAFADAGGGKVTVTSAGHGFLTGAKITISGTTNYNGDYTIGTVATDTFPITAGWAGDDGTGTATQVPTNAILRLRSANTTSGTWDFQYTGAQLEPNPYATSFIPTTTAALSRPADVLRYVNSGNRTAATESIFVKFAPNSAFANDGVERRILASQTKDRNIKCFTTSDKVSFRPNETDSSSAVTTSTTVLQANTSYVVAGIAVGATGDPNAIFYVNGSSENSTNTDWTVPAWGTSFFVGSNAASTAQLNGIIQSCCFYSDVKDATAVAAITKVLQ